MDPFHVRDDERVRALRHGAAVRTHGLEVRERPLQLFGLLALALAGAGLVFGAAGVGVVLSAPGSYLPSSFVLPTAGLLCLEVAAFLVMFGLIAEEAVQGQWRNRSPRGPVVREWGEAT